MFARFVASACLSSLVLALAGCGASSSETSAVTGRVVNNGSPLAVKGQQVGVGRIELHFIPVQGGGSRIALVQPDGKFILDQPGEFTAGKYKLAIYAWEPAADPSKAAATSGLADQLQGAFSKDNTPIEREIALGQDLGEIDLAKFTTKLPAKS